MSQSSHPSSRHGQRTTWRGAGRGNQQRRNRQTPVPAQPVNPRSSESTSTRSSSDSARGNDANGMSIELERLAQRERNEWSQSAASSGLRHRRPTVVPEEVRSPSACARIITFDIILPNARPARRSYPFPSNVAYACHLRHLCAVVAWRAIHPDERTSLSGQQPCLPQHESL